MDTVDVSMNTVDEINKKKYKNNVDNQKFLRDLTDEEKTDYAAIKGPRAQQRKREFRDMLAVQKLKNCNASQQNVTSSSQSDTMVGTYRNYWMIVEKEGGLLNKEFAMAVATNICKRCESKGPPAVMYDPAGEVVRYLHCELGVTDAQSRMRTSILSAEVDMPENEVRLAMQQAANEGLSSTIPSEALAKGCGAPIDVVSPAKPASRDEPEVTGNGEIENTKSPAKIPEKPALFDLAKALLAGNDSNSSSGSGSNSLVSAMLLQQIIENQKATSLVAVDSAAAVEKLEKEKLEKAKLAKVKTAEEKLWQECTAFGRKLDGMCNHAASIVEQSKEDTNDWRWACTQIGTLEDQLTSVQPIVRQWSSAVRTSSLAALLKNKGSKECTNEWLQALKTSINAAITDIETPLGVLVGMHNCMLRKRFSTQEPKKAKKAKA